MNQFDYQRALFASELSTIAKFAGVVIGSHYNWKTGEYSFVSNNTIARETSLSVSSVSRGRKELVENGYLSSDRRYDNTCLMIPIVPETRPSSQIDELKDTLKDNLKDTLKDTIKDSDESLIEVINTKVVEDIWESFTPTINEQPLTNKESEPRPAAAIPEEWLSW